MRSGTGHDVAMHLWATSDQATAKRDEPRRPVPRGTATLLLAAVLAATLTAACGGVTTGDRVALLTATLGCYAGGEHPMTAELVADPEHGTTFGGVPVVWPTGYTGRRVGTEIEVLDGAGTVRATTGRRYWIAPAYDGETTDITTRYPAAVECGYEWDFGECDVADAPPAYCEPEPIPGGSDEL